MPLRPGIVHLRDLAHRYQWQTRAIVQFVAAARLEVAPEPTWRSFAPPRVLIVIAPFSEPELLPRSRTWLAETAHIVIVRDATTDGDILSDDELRAAIETAWRDVLATMPPADLYDWLDPSDDAIPQAAIRDAIERAKTATESPLAARANPDLELSATPWFQWRSAWKQNMPRLVAARLAIRDDRVVLFDDRGSAIDLAALAAPAAIEISGNAVFGQPPATAAPTDGRGSHPGYYAHGIDPVHPVAWRGHRMAVYWMYVGATETGFLSATDHDWPCGPSKKLWGFDDNDPVAIAVTPQGDLCAQTFEHDVLITVGMPVGWHRAGEVDVAAFVRDPRRALYYAQTADFVKERSVDDLLEEDNRELAPVVVLGPDDATRYAVDLRHRVVRITYGGDAEVATIIDGPEAGYAVFDADHRLVRRGDGVLLGGWFRYATIEQAGFLWREDLATGERTLLGDATRALCLDPRDEVVVQDAIREGRHEAAAQLRASVATRPIEGEIHVIAIPGTRNVIEIADGFLRVL